MKVMADQIIFEPNPNDPH